MTGGHLRLCVDFFCSSCSFGKKCEFVELQDMMHGFLLEGERSIEAIAVQSRLSMKKAGEFLEKFVGNI